VILPTEICATFAIVATCQSREPDPLANVETLEQAVLEHVEAIRSAGPTAEELERARRSLLLAHHDSRQDLALCADRLSCAATYFDDPSRIFSEPERLLQVDREQVRDLARRALAAERRAATIVVPKA
ncbi:MAG: insulinase family protein, partial [bacterium]|nr:insulinase family protein [bacterium]